MQVSGLEINESNVSILSLRRSGNKLYVVSFARVELMMGTIENGILKNPEILVRAFADLQRLAHPKKVTSPYVVVSLPESLVYQKITTLPNLEEEKLKEAIEINLPDLLPGKKEEIFWGWQEIVGDKSKKEILVASALKESISKYFEALAKAGFIPVAVESFSLSSGRAFSKLIGALYISLEKNSATAFILERGTTRFAASFSLVGEKPGEILLKNTKRILDFYQAEKKINNLEIYLVGSGSTAEIQKLLEEKIGVVVKPGQELMVFPQGEIKSPAVLGAAIRGLIDQRDDTSLSLLPVGSKESYQEKRALKIIGGITNIFAITCLLFMMLFGAVWGFLYYLNNNTANQLSNIIQTKVDPTVKDIQDKLKILNPKLSYIKQLLASNNTFPDTLSTIKDAGAEGISFTTINLPKEGKAIAVTGNAQSRDAIALFKNNLEKSGAFDRIDFSSTNIGEGSTSFTVNLTMKK